MVLIYVGPCQTTNKVWVHNEYTTSTYTRQLVHHEYLHNEYTMSTPWVTMSTPWVTMSTPWVHHEYTRPWVHQAMSTPWVHHEYTMSTQWIHCLFVNNYKVNKTETDVVLIGFVNVEKIFGTNNTNKRSSCVTTSWITFQKFTKLARARESKWTV